VGSLYYRADMLLLESHDGTDKRTNGRTPGHYVTLPARRVHWWAKICI